MVAAIAHDNLFCVSENVAVMKRHCDIRSADMSHVTC